MNDLALIEFLKQLRDQMITEAEAVNEHDYSLGLRHGAEIVEDAIKDIQENP